MAFDAFRSQTQARPRRRRRITYTLSLALHGALVVVGVAYSFWHVEELTPPTVRVTFMSAVAPTAPPPPPPPPPAGGGGAPKKRVVLKSKPVVVPTKPPEIVQPRETPPPPKDESKPDDRDQAGGQKGGVKGGVIGGQVGGVAGGTVGGVVGGTPGATGTAPPPSKLLPPNLGALQKVSGDDPPFPPSLRRAGMTFAIVAKICVSRTGTVEGVTLMKKADPLLDAGVLATVKGWRFRPLMANNTAIPFCYPAMFQFKGQ